MLHAMSAEPQPKLAIHLMVSRYGDPILFVKEQDANKVHISGAERSCGLRWAAGEFTSEEARELWETVIREGGRMADRVVVEKFLAILDLHTRHLTEKIDSLTYELDKFRKRNEVLFEKNQVLSEGLATCMNRLDNLQIEFQSTVTQEVDQKVNIVLDKLLGCEDQEWNENYLQ